MRKLVGRGLGLALLALLALLPGLIERHFGQVPSTGTRFSLISRYAAADDGSSNDGSSEDDSDDANKFRVVTPTIGRPNFVVLLLDDADVDLLTDESLTEHFPHLDRLRREGLRFTNFHVTTPLCGPSRMSLLTGLYPQRSQIRVNDGAVERSRGAAGGTAAAMAAGLARDNLGTRLRQVGMRTMFVGKYMNNGFVPKVAPGWSDFAATAGANYYDFRVFQNLTKPQGEFLKPHASVYRTRYEGNLAVQMLDREFDRAGRRPFLLFLSQLAPHLPSETSPVMVEPKQANYGPSLRVPRTADFDEMDVSDKPRAIRQLPRLSTARVNLMDRIYRDRIRSVRSVDEQLGRIMAKIGSSDEADRTYVIVTSDNGYSLGHHRFEGKALPYERCSNVPLLVWGPGVPEGASSDQLLSSIDLLPTLVEGAGGGVAGGVDGISFLNAWFDPLAAAAAPTRSVALIENIESKSENGRNLPSTYVMLRMHDEVYSEWSNGDREYYDLAVDPYQLDNRIAQLGAADAAAFRTLIHAERGTAATFNAIESPAVGRSIGPRSTWRGWSEANAGIDDVGLEIRNPRTGRWWSGSSWVNRAVSVPVAGPSPGDLLADWRVSVRLNPTGRWNEALLVRSVMTDVEGRKRATRWQRMTAELSAPRIVRRIPESAGWSVRRGTRPLTVRIVDHSPIRRATAVIRDLNRSRYWNGKSWQLAKTTVPLRRSSGGDWTVAPRFPAGRYRIEIHAEDSRGNRTPTPTVVQVLAT